ncbi:LuxR C-terminal-related transcriptional regulator [Flavobacterium sp. ST-75]|uniref:LuxR C-terminal-related transcriptional regulator n=1 Tax=Flavobacterium rhizophilum TaxID=3163296 RepID=A0ABW8YIY4_9FLAO
MIKAIKKHKGAILYGSSLALLLLLLRWLEFRFLVLSTSLDIYIGIIAIIFTALGVWLALKLFKPKAKTIIIEKEVEVYVTPSPQFERNQKELDNLNLTSRELEVLELMAKGMSNQEIANELFVSLNTIKTHSGKLFEKMEVKRRTQAVDKAKTLSIIP